MFQNALKNRLPYLVIAVTILILAAVFLRPSSWEFPMDDTYIHFVYAQNLAETGRLFFNTTNEVGVGSTSLTWVLLLAGAYRMGIPFQIAAKAFGLLALIGAGWGLYALFMPLLRPPPALALALIISASGHMLWFALSGMETVLFLALGIFALLFYRDRRWLPLGLVLGLLAVTRPDGLALAAAIGLVELWQHRNNLHALPRGLFTAGLACLLVCAPWFLYLYSRTGSILPTSALGKQTSSLIGIRLILSQSPALASLASFPAVIYIGTWIIYIFGFVLGGASFPGPAIAIGQEVGNANYAISLLAAAGWILVIIPLLFRFYQQARRFVYQKKYQEEKYRPIAAFIVWLVLHNLAYAFFLPIPGTASRYGTINHVALWLALMVGLVGTTARPPWRIIWTIGLAVIAITNTLYWNRVYDANLEHMLNVRIAASKFIAQQTSPKDPIAAFDIGAIRFYSGRKIIDLGGLTDPALGDVYHTDGRIDRYLEEREVRYVVLPGRTNTENEGWFDFARQMGLTSSPWFALQQLHVFEIDYDRWLLGYLPTNNYQATVTIYQVQR